MTFDEKQKLVEKLLNTALLIQEKEKLLDLYRWCLNLLDEMQAEEAVGRGELIEIYRAYALSGIAHVFIESGDRAGAMEHFLKSLNSYSTVINMVPHNLEAYHNRGLVYETMGILTLQQDNLKEAEKFFLKALDDYNVCLQRIERGAHIWQSRARLYELLGDMCESGDTACDYYQKSLNDVLKAVELNPLALTAYMRGIRLFKKLSSEDSATELLVKLEYVLRNVKVKGDRVILNLGGKTYEEDAIQFAREFSMLRNSTTE